MNYPFYYIFIVEKCKYHDIFNTEEQKDTDPSVDDQVLGEWIY